jgi:hypothetical protein
VQIFLIQYINHEKKKAPNYEEVLDYVICTTSFSNITSSIEILDHETFGSDHSPIKVSISSKTVKKNKTKNKVVYMYQKANWHLFRETLIKLNQNTNYSLLDAYEAVEKITKDVNEAVQTSIPQKTLNTDSKPPFPIEIRNLIKLKNKSAKLNKKNKILGLPTEESYQKLKNDQKNVKIAIAKYNNDSWNSFVKNLGPSPMSSSKWWVKIKKCQAKKSNYTSFKLKIDDEIIEDEDKIAQVFLDKMNSTLNENSENNFDINFKENIETETRTLINDLKRQKMDFEPITIVEIKNAIKSLNSKISTDSYNISNKAIKELPEEILESLKSTFNKSLLESTISSCWKSADITMIPKKGDPKDIKNYRPISITPVLMRLFEKIILARIQVFIEKNNLIVKEQSGFRRRRSTKDNLTYMTQKILESFESKKKLCVI